MNHDDYKSDETWGELEALMRVIVASVEDYGRNAALVIKAKIKAECVNDDGTTDFAAAIQAAQTASDIVARSVEGCVDQAFQNLNAEAIKVLTDHESTVPTAPPEQDEDELARQAVAEAERFLYEAGE